MWRTLFQRSALRPDRQERDDFPIGFIDKRDCPNSVLDIVLIHEITQGREDAWPSTGNIWIDTLCGEDFPRPRIIAFGYEPGVCRQLHDLINPRKLQENAEALLRKYPLCVPSEEPTPSSRDEEGNQQRIADEETMFQIDAERPVIFIAHGFGGLIYEKALTMSYNPGQLAARWRKHAALLLDTPHYQAGVADWAIMCANLLGIPSAKTARKQNWSNLQLKASLEDIDHMQREFRRIRKAVAVDIVGCYATRPVAGYNLKLAPEWVVLPDFQSMALHDTHFGMSEGKGADPGLQKSVLGKLIGDVLKGGAQEEEPSLPNHLNNLHRILQCTEEDLEEIVNLCSSITGAVQSLIEFYSPYTAIRYDIDITREDLQFLFGILKTFHTQLKLRPEKPKSFRNNITLLASHYESIVNFRQETSKVVNQDVDHIKDNDTVLPRSFQRSVLEELRERIHTIASHVSRILYEDGNIRRAPIKLLKNVRSAKYSTTPLHWAAQNGHLFFARLVAELEDIDALDVHDLTPLDWAAAGGQETMVKVLVDANINKKKSSPPSAHCHMATLQNATKNRKILRAAIIRGNADIVKILLDKGTDVDTQSGEHNSSAIYLASENGHERIVKILQKRRASVSTQYTSYSSTASLIERERKNSLGQDTINTCGNVSVTPSVHSQPSVSVAAADPSIGPEGGQASSFSFEVLEQDGQENQQQINQPEAGSAVKLDPLNTLDDPLGKKYAGNPLASRILEASTQSQFDDSAPYFLPEGLLGDLVTSDAVREEIPDLREPRNEAVLQFILKEAPRVFAIAISCSIRHDWLLWVMQTCQFYNFSDASLPLDERMDAFQSKYEAFHDDFWTKDKMNDFYTKQWRFLSPVFKKSDFVYTIEPSCILPITWKSSEAKEGYSSQVFEVEIHPSHQEEPENTVDGGPAHFAIKEIQSTERLKLEDVEKIWEHETQSLNDLSGLNHPHIIPRVAAIKRGVKRYFLFPWADGGSLAEYWQKTERPNLSSELVRDVIQQLKGLADALFALHHYNATENYRHGDLKPENILRFKTRADEQHLGTLKIADLGLAKRHADPTDVRGATSTMYGTARYESPEARIDAARSRLYDIWSMGCIILEVIVWMLYGYDQVRNLQQSIDKDFSPDKGTYFKIDAPGEKPHVHRIIASWMSYIRTNDPECSQPSAMRDLLALVETKLLIVPLPKKPENTTVHESDSQDVPPILADNCDDEVGPVRATSDILVESLGRILKGIEENATYAFTGKQRANIHGPGQQALLTTQDGFLAVPKVDKSKPGPASEGLQKIPESGLPIIQRDDPLNKIWGFSVDNDFASRTLQQRGNNFVSPPSPNSSQLCSRCTSLDFGTPLFEIDDLVSSFKEKSGKCDFCHLLWQSCLRANLDDSEAVRFSRVESTLRLNKFHDGNAPVLSLIRSPELRTPTQIQIGLPKLPESGSEYHFDTIRGWLEDCDANHPKCRPQDQKFLPTRLIDVGNSDRPCLRLHETSTEDICKYIALSHPWGDPKISPHFCTFKSNIAAYKQEIEFDELPATFKDAVMTTRALGFRYLWIDSLCIIQGKDGDFNFESKRMEDVFSSAYCVLAASRATHQADGFLQGRPQRKFVTFQRGDQRPFYVTESIEDFNQDVLEGFMCKRAWVLQERALAHRTIYFTERQTYWECGDGVRCETGFKMRNGLAAFLGDPNFPEVAVQSSRGGKIRLYQDLYMQYSRLGFTKIEDRPIAISGLEKRLLHNFKTTGGYGVFDDGPNRGWLRRSLLWCRDNDEPTMVRIVFPVDRSTIVPTWSWMAYKGAINYLDLPFEKVDWQQDEISSPWSSGRGSVSRTREYDDDISLMVTARDFDIAKSERDSELVFDIPGKTDGQRFKCVIVGRDMGDAPLEKRRHYVLIISPKMSGLQGTSQTYARVGVGHMLGNSISYNFPGERVKVI